MEKIRKAAASSEARLDRPKHIKGIPVLTEPLVLMRRRRQEQAFLGRHPFLDPAAVQAVREVAQECNLFSQSAGFPTAVAYAHVQRCSRCALALERRQDEELVAV